MSIRHTPHDRRRIRVFQSMQQFQKPVSRPFPELTEEGMDLKKTLDELEDRLILDALKMAGGVKNKAAQLLGLNRTTLIEKMKKKKILYPA